MSVTVRQDRIDFILRTPSGPTGQFLYRTGLRIESVAKRLTPVDTGRLRSSIHTTLPESTGTGLVVRIGSQVNYALYVEQGTRFFGPRSFLEAALRGG